MQLFNSYEAGALLGFTSNHVNVLARAGHLKVFNVPISPLASKRSVNIYALEDLESYSSREFTAEQIISARAEGERRQRADHDLRDPKHKHKRATRTRAAVTISHAMGTIGRSSLPAEEGEVRLLPKITPSPVKFLSKVEAMAKYAGAIDQAYALVEAWRGEDYGPEETLKRAIWMVAHGFEGPDSFDTDTFVLTGLARAL